MDKDLADTPWILLASEPGKWQKLSPIAILYFAERLIRQLASQFIYLLPALLVGYAQIRDNPGLWLPVLSALLTLVGLFAWLSFHYYRYRLYKGHLQIRSGVLHKKHLDLPFERIQNIKLEQPLYYRYSRHVCMLLDSAGSHKQEARIYALAQDFAERLKREILRQGGTTEGQQADKEADPAVTEQEKLLISRSVPDLVVHGITSNRIWIFLGGLAPFFDNLFALADEQLSRLGLDLDGLLNPAGQAWWQFGLYVVSLVFILMALLTLLSIAGSLIAFYGYRLTRSDDRYIRRSGLLTRHEVSMKLSRLQVIVRKQDWLDRLIGRINLKFEQLNANIEHTGAVAVSGKLMVPSIDEVQCQALIDDIYPSNQMAQIRYQGISRRFILRNGLLALLPFAGLTGILLFKGESQAMAVCASAYLLTLALIWQRWRRWGWAVDEEFVYLRKGLLGVDYYCFPFPKVQQTKFRQSIWMKPARLCSVTLVLASGGQTIPFLPEIDGRRLIDISLYQLERLKASWM